MSAIPSPSLYEKLNLTPKIMRQRVVENFSGALLNERWNTTLESGTPTFAMSDTIDGGFETTMTTAAFNALKVNFNNRRQYDPNGCVSICWLVPPRTVESLYSWEWSCSYIHSTRICEHLGIDPSINILNLWEF